MRPRVTAIVVGQNSAAALARTLPALESQTRAPNRTVLVSLTSRDATASLMRTAKAEHKIEMPERATFGEAVNAAVAKCAADDERENERIESLGGKPEDENDWLWILGADNTPDPDALEELLDTTERNPSLEVTGPKIVHADDPGVLVEYGESITHSGIAVRLHEDAIDQGQFEHLSDVLAVAAGGMLVRRDTWDRLRGFDPGLPAVDDGLDFCVRTWLSGGRVLLSPRARVESLDKYAVGTTHYGRRTRPLQRYRIRRTAQLHRQLVWAGPVEFVLRWLLLLPLALLRTISHLVRKNPGRILPDWRAAITVFFLQTGVPRSRRQFNRTRKHPLQSLARLWVTPTEWRKMRINRRDEYRAATQSTRDRYNFITGGGGWVALIGVGLAAVLLFPLLNTATIAGGALLPLSSITDLWGSTGYGLRDTGGGVGVADPFNYVLALLGTFTFWNPSQSIQILWLIAIPLSGVGAWFLAARLTRNGWVRTLVANAWMIAPPLFVALSEGRITGVIVHAVLPWLLFTGLAATRSWVAAAACSLLALVVAACSPILLPLLALVWLLGLPISGRGWARLVFTPIPTIAMFLPLLVTHFNRGRPFAIFADPGMPLPVEPVHGWEALSLYADAGNLSLHSFAENLGIPADMRLLVLALLLVPLALLAVAGLVAHTWRVALAGILFAALGFVTAGLAGSFVFSSTAGEPVPIWVGPAQSLGLLGLLLAAAAGIVALRTVGAVSSVVALVAVALMAVPVAPAQLNGTAQVEASAGRTLPALVDAQGAAARELGTLVISPLGANEMHVHLERGSGQTLDEFSTLETTNTSATRVDGELAQIAVGFLSAGASNPTAQLHDLGIGFVLVKPASSGGAVLEQRLITALSTNEAVTGAGEANNFGVLYQVVNKAEKPTDPELAGALNTTNWQNDLGRIMLITQGAVLLFVLLLALPTGGLEARARDARILRRERWENLDRGALAATFRDPSDTVEIYADQATGDHVTTGGGDRLGDE